MFDQNELAQLEQVLEKAITKTVPPLVERIVDEKLVSLMEHQIMPQFDLIHDELATKASKEDFADLKREVIGLKNHSATKGWVEDRLDSFRIDHRLKYKPAT